VAFLTFLLSVKERKRLSCFLYSRFMFTGSWCPAVFCSLRSTDQIEGQRYSICTDSDLQTSHGQNCSKDRKET